MNYAAIGKMLRLLREEQKISQTKLAEGIMSRENLSRIEMGEQKVSKDKLDLLFNRLGAVAKRFFAYPLTEEEYKAYELRAAFTNAQAKYDTAGMEALIIQMEQMPEFQTGLHRQSLLFNKATLCLRRDKDDRDTAMNYLREAIQCTIPQYNPRLVYTYLLGDKDHEIIAMMARMYFETNERDKAVDTMTRLAENIRKRIFDSQEKARSLTFVLYNLSRMFAIMERWQEALDTSSEGIETGVENQEVGNLPLLTWIKSRALYSLGQKDEVLNLVHQAYYGSLIQGDLFEAGIIKKNALELMDIEIFIPK